MHKLRQIQFLWLGGYRPRHYPKRNRIRKNGNAPVSGVTLTAEL